jgi:gliding motility-associated-like protein
LSTTQTACGVNNGSATVTANGGAGNLTYSWSNGGASTTTITNIGAGIHSVIITDSLGCTKTVSGTVTTTGGPTANAGTDVTILSGSSTQLSASGGGTYGWAPPTGLSCDTCRAPIANPLVTTSYCVTVSVSGCSDTACVTVTVTDTAGGGCGTLFLPTGSVYVPNAFTPTNNDFLNDVYKPVVNCVHDYNFLIFDRWGEKIFETTNTNEGWNGYYKGRMCESEIYVYKISFIDDTKNDFHQYIGKVTLLK